MTVGSPLPLEVEWDLVEQGVFTAASVSRLVQVVRAGNIDESHYEALADYLNKAVRQYFMARRTEEDLRPLQRAKLARRVASACAEVLDACGVSKDARIQDLHPALSEGGLFAFAAIRSGSIGSDAIQHSLLEVRKLLSHAESLEQRCLLNDGRWVDNTVEEADLVKARKASHVGSPAFGRLLEALGDAFSHWWLRVPGRGTAPDGTVGSPFVRFMSGVTNHMSTHFRSFHKREPAALASAWRRTRSADDMAILKKNVTQFMHAKPK